MYNDKNGQLDRRRPSVRQVYPAANMTETPDMRSVPRVDDKIGGRLCDGSMPEQQGNTENTHSGWGLREFPLAMVYSPYQLWREIYSPDTALSRGTLFSELDLPFEGSGRNGGC